MQKNWGLTVKDMNKEELYKEIIDIIDNDLNDTLKKHVPILLSAPYNQPQYLLDESEYQFALDDENLNVIKYISNKAKLYIIEELIMYLVLFKNQENKEYTKNNMKIMGPILLWKNNIVKEPHISYAKTIEDNGLKKQKENYSTAFNNLFKYKHSDYDDDETFKLHYALSYPYKHFYNILNYTFDFDYFFKDDIFDYSLRISEELPPQKKLIPTDFNEYCGTLMVLFASKSYTDFLKANNIFKLIQTVLNNIEDDNYDTNLNTLINRYNEDIQDISCVYSKISNNPQFKKVIYHHLFSKSYHTNFFISLTHPFIQILFKRINIKSLCFATDEIINLIDNDSFLEANYEYSNHKDTMYHLKILELLMYFDINLKNISTQNDFFPLKEKLIILEKNNKRSFEALLDFFYSYLEDVQIISKEIVPSLINNIQDFYDNATDNNLEFIDYLISNLIRETETIYKLFPNDLDFKQINYDPEETKNSLSLLIKDNPILIAYLIKYSLVGIH